MPRRQSANGRGGLALSPPDLSRRFYRLENTSGTPEDRSAARVPCVSLDYSNRVGVIGGSFILFLAGVALAWGIVLPSAVQWLMGLQHDALTPIITARECFAFATDM